MKTAMLLLALLGCAAFVAAEIETEDNVLVLTDDNFDEALSAHTSLLVEFYAPWCGHCKRLAPEYAAAAEELGSQDPPLFLAKVDATENRELAEKFEVQGFPTLKFFRGGKPTEYGGGRTKSEIVNWVNKKSGPPAKDLDSTDAAEAFIEKSEVSVIGFFESADSPAAKGFLAAAASNDDVPFGITTSKEVAAKYDVTAPGISLFKDFDEKRNNFDGDFAAEEINTFVSANQLPLVVPFSQEAAPKIFGGAIKVHYLYFLDTETDEAESAIESFREVAAAVRGRALAITVNLEHDRVMGYFGITEDDLPTAVLVHMPDGGQMKKYLYDGEELEKEAMIDFAERYFAGSLKPFLKSAEEPENNDEPVTVLVGKNFEKIALDSNKDVFVEFYAPWCGHCKALAPKWEEVGEKFADLENVVIAKMDATANEVDHPDVNVRGFPTLKFFPAGEGASVVDYNGARETEDLIKFVKENAKSDLGAVDDEAEL